MSNIKVRFVVDNMFTFVTASYCTHLHLQLVHLFRLPSFTIKSEARSGTTYKAGYRSFQTLHSLPCVHIVNMRKLSLCSAHVQYLRRLSASKTFPRYFFFLFKSAGHTLLLQNSQIAEPNINFFFKRSRFEVTYFNGLGWYEKKQPP